MSSRFVHVTVVPAATVSAVGPKLKLSIFTSAPDVGACAALAVKPLESRTNCAAAKTIGVAKAKIHTRLLMILISFRFLSVEFVARCSLAALKPAKSQPPRGPAGREHNSRP